MKRYEELLQMLNKIKIYRKEVKIITSMGRIIAEPIETADKNLEFHAYAMQNIAHILGIPLGYQYNSFAMAKELTSYGLVVLYLDGMQCLVFLPDNMERWQYETLGYSICTLKDYVFYFASYDEVFDNRLTQRQALEFMQTLHQPKRRLLKKRNENDK